MRPHILGLVHAVLLSGAISEQAADDGGGVVALSASDSSVSTSILSSSSSNITFYSFPRPEHTSPADYFFRLREQCPVYGAPALPVTVPPIIAPTPLPDHLAGLADENELESFEDWKRRKEAEDAPASIPEEDSPGRTRENKSAEAGGGAQPAAPESGDVNTTSDNIPNPPPPPLVPKKGGHRYNYASPDCSARVLSSSALTQHASSLLHKSRDRYMLTPCRADEHWVVIELCDEIRVEALELAVWEFFSGIVRGITVSVGDEAGGSSWSQVGEFVGKNVRGAQTFTLPEPTSFHRFLRLDFPSFYGSEYYCPISQLKVHGMNQMEAFKMEQRRAAEASGAKTREREEHEREKEREREEKDREVEKAREAAEAVAREQQRVDDERREKELCELERLVQEQAMRAGEVVLEPSVCIPSDPPLRGPPAQPATASNSTGSGANSTVSVNQQAGNNSTDPTSSSSAMSSTYTAAGSPRTDSSESIYAFITRRLNALEGNSTLVARYIDEQAKALRVALTRAETRWEVSRIVAAKDDEHRWETERMRQEDRLGRIISQMEAMRNSMESERRMTESQLRVLTDELGFERRKSLAQLIILVVAIILGVLSRGDSIDALLRALAAQGKRNHARPRTTLSRHQRQLSTGPLAGLLIDVASPTTSNTTNPSTPTASHQSEGAQLLSQRSSAGKAPRRSLTPNSNIRRRVTSNSRSFSAEPGQFPLDLSQDGEGFVSPGRRNILSQRRRLARSSHLHPIRRRGDESSEAEGNREKEREPVPVASSTPTSPLTAIRSASVGFFPSPSPAAAAAAVAAVKSGFTAAPDADDITEDGASAPDSASEVEDEVKSSAASASDTLSRRPVLAGSATGSSKKQFGKRLLDRFNEIAAAEEADKSAQSGRTIRRARYSEGSERGKEQESRFKF